MDVDESQKQEHIDFWVGIVREAVLKAEEQGVIVTAERLSLKPLAQGNHIPLVKGYFNHRHSLKGTT